MRERPRATFIALRARRTAYQIATDILYDPPIRRAEQIVSVGPECAKWERTKEEAKQETWLAFVVVLALVVWLALILILLIVLGQLQP